MCSEATAERILKLVKAMPEDKVLEVLDFAEFLNRREEEDREDVQIAEQRLKALAQGRSRTFTLDQVERDLGLAD